MRAVVLMAARCAAAFLLAMAATGAQAQSKAVKSACFQSAENETVRRNGAIHVGGFDEKRRQRILAACTTLIDGSGTSEQDRADAYAYRGEAHLATTDGLFSTDLNLKANADFDAALAIKPNDVRILHLAAYNKRSLDLYERIIELKPDDISALSMKARLLFEEQKYADASPVFEKAYRLNGNRLPGDGERLYGDTLNIIGTESFDKGDYAAAFEIFNRSVSVRKFYQSLANRGNAREKLGMLKAAAEDYRAAIQNVYEQKSKDKYGAYLKSVEAKISALNSDRTACASTDPDTSLAACTRILDGNASPNDVDRVAILRQRGMTLLAKGETDRATADFDSAIALRPADAVAIRKERDAALARIAAARQPEAPKPVPAPDPAPAKVAEVPAKAAEARPPEAPKPAPPAAPAPVAPPPAQLAAKTPVPPAPVADASNRLALVIGNGDYLNVSTLRNPAADAKAISEKLAGKGFRVTTRLNLGRSEFMTTVDAFRRSVRKGDEVVIYYAGHGVELSGANYLLPIDVPKLSPKSRFIPDSAVSLTSLLTELSGVEARATIVILDACRNNPFPEDLQVASNTRSAGPPSEGLTRVDPPRGAMVIYSAGVNQTAIDRLGDGDPDPNGLFTRHLLRLMDEDVDINIMAKRLRGQVFAAAQTMIDAETGKPHAQTPAVYDEMIGSFYFSRKGG